MKNTEISKQADEILKTLSLSQKAELLSQVVWETTPVDHISKKLSKFLLADGPAGVRRLKEYFDDDIYNTKPSTAYPSPSTYASSWNKDLLHDLGKHIGEEALQENVDTMLAPAINLKRSPLGGRNFEYYSEDPYLTSELATSFIKGLQSQGIGACVKHFALNNQETRRMNINVKVDSKTLHELYLRTFEKPIKEGKPKMVMAAYNQVNGEYCASNSKLLNILKKQYHYDGVVVTDCFAAHDLAKGIKYGLSLQMPGTSKKRISEEIKKYIKNGELTEEELDRAVKKNIIFALDAASNRSKRRRYNRDAHHDFSRKVAEESIVLLKNDNNVLPLTNKKNILIVGKIAKSPIFQGGGSSHVNPYRLENSWDEIKKISKNIDYSEGYNLDNPEDYKLIDKAVIAAKNKDVIIVFAGLPNLSESEGYDRKDISLPDNQNKLILELAKLNKPIVVVLSNGSVVEMPWKQKVTAILEGYLSGEAGGSAIANILFGKTNPSGHLAETFPEKLEDTPTYLNFPGTKHEVIYGEGRFIGYKYYEAKRKQVAYPFGYGLSYTKFKFDNIKKSLNNKSAIIALDIKNVGKVKGKVVAQVYSKFLDYVGSPEPLQLAGFKKIELRPGEVKRVSIALDSKVFQTYNTVTNKWIRQNGKYELFVGMSSADKSQVFTVNIDADSSVITADDNLGDILRLHPDIYPKLSKIFEKYPKSLNFVKMLKDNNPLKALSTASLMTLNTLKRADSDLDDAAVKNVLLLLNKKE